jgi:hypothetical protein
VLNEKLIFGRLTFGFQRKVSGYQQGAVEGRLGAVEVKNLGNPHKQRGRLVELKVRKKGGAVDRGGWGRSKS